MASETGLLLGEFLPEGVEEYQQRIEEGIERETDQYLPLFAPVEEEDEDRDRCIATEMGVVTDVVIRWSQDSGQVGQGSAKGGS